MVRERVKLLQAPVDLVEELKPVAGIQRGEVVDGRVAEQPLCEGDPFHAVAGRGLALSISPIAAAYSASICSFRSGKTNRWQDIA